MFIEIIQAIFNNMNVVLLRFTMAHFNNHSKSFIPSSLAPCPFSLPLSGGSRRGAFQGGLEGGYFHFTSVVVGTYCKVNPVVARFYTMFDDDFIEVFTSLLTDIQ